MKIYIARHGQDEDNANGIMNGQRNGALTELGRSQAKSLANEIRNLGLTFSKIYSSPLKRAHETAQIIADTLDFKGEVELMDNLKERDLGTLTGRDLKDVYETYTDNVLKTDTITYFLEPVNGENFPKAIKRAKRVLDEIHNKSAEGDILLVCHGDIGKMIYAVASNTPWKDVLINFHFGNGDLIDVSDSNAHLVKLEQHNV